MPRWARAVAVVAVAVLCARVLHAMYDKSPCNDEPKHLITGHTFWRTRLCCLGGNNTPMTALYAIPEVVADTPIRSHSLPVVHRRYLRARLVNLPFLILLATTVFLASRQLFRWPGGLLSLVLLSFSPNVAAHAALVSPDFQVAVFFLPACLALAMLVRGAQPWRAMLFAGVALALAVLAKFSGLALAPAFLIVPVMFGGGGWRARCRRLALGAGALVIGFLSIQAVYELPFLILGPHLVRDVGGLDRDLDRLPYRPSELKQMIEGGNHGFGFFAGVAGTRASVSEGYGTYLNGKVGEKQWLYYPEAVLLKTPLPILVLGAWALWRLRRRWREPMIVALLAGACFLGGGAMIGKLQLGVRHLLPIYPVMFVLAGACLQREPGRWVPRVVLLLLVPWAVFEGVRYHPHYLAYFNQLAGGPEHGARFLAADNLDWGQDLRNLRKFQLEHATGKIALRYFGSVPAYRYDISFDLLTSQPTAGWIAISRTSLVCEMELIDTGATHGGVKRRAFAWLDRFEPVALVGYSIAVYHITEAELRRAGY
ncbi:MAG: glycosyltransferase family 39 protein [Planctomycetota bacterium]